MKLKDGLILRKVADEYLIVPTGQLIQISPIMRISRSAAYLWEFMKEDEFSEELLVEIAKKHFSGVSEETLKRDIGAFLELLQKNHMLEQKDEAFDPICGEVAIKIDKEDWEKVRPQDY